MLVRALGIATLLAFAVWMPFGYGYVEDDAFIHLEFARSVSEGRGFAFNGLTTYGDTSPLWVLLLAAVHSFGFGWVFTAKACCAAGLGVALAAVWKVGTELGSYVDHRAAHFQWLAAAALVLIASSPYFILWSFSGMESVTALGTSLWTLWCACSREPFSRARLLCGIALSAIGPVLRPELMLLSVATAPFFLAQAWKLAGAKGVPSKIVVAALVGFALLLPTALWVGYAAHTFGSITPNTNAAKRLLGGTGQAAARLISVYGVGFASTLLVAPVLGVRLRRLAVPPLVWALSLWPLTCAAFYVLDHTAVQTRYCLLSMPCLGLAVLWALWETGGPKAVRGFSLISLAVACAMFVMMVRPHVLNKARLVETVRQAAVFIRNELPPDAPLAIYSIGEVAFESRHPVIDLGGITRLGVLPFLGDVQASVNWARGQGARFYAGGDAPFQGSVRIYSFQEPFVGWSFRPGAYDEATTTGIYTLEQGESAWPAR
jgi:hypothetical protein